MKNNKKNSEKIFNDLFNLTGFNLYIKCFHNILSAQLSNKFVGISMFHTCISPSLHITGAVSLTKKVYDLMKNSIIQSYLCDQNVMQEFEDKVYLQSSFRNKAID